MSSEKNKCPFCEKTFSTSYNMKKHLETIHKQQVEYKPNTEQKCPLCTENVGKSLEDLQTHVHKFHDIQIEDENISFQSALDFIHWKQNEEKLSKAMFIKKRMTVERKDVKCTTYYCNRSGFFKSNSNGQRHSKILGSNKINASCPARMKVKVFSNDRVEINYIKTHIGHTMDVARMRIAEDVRQSIAVKLANNIPISQILDDVKNNEDSDVVGRISLLNRRDVINIATCYNLKSKEIFEKRKSVNKCNLRLRETGANESVEGHETGNDFLADDVFFSECGENVSIEINDSNGGIDRTKRCFKATKMSPVKRKKTNLDGQIIANYFVIETQAV